MIHFLVNPSMVTPAHLSSLAKSKQPPESQASHVTDESQIEETDIKEILKNNTKAINELSLIVRSLHLENIQLKSTVEELKKSVDLLIKTPQPLNFGFSGFQAPLNQPVNASPSTSAQTYAGLASKLNNATSNLSNSHSKRPRSDHSHQPHRNNTPTTTNLARQTQLKSFDSYAPHEPNQDLDSNNWQVAGKKPNHRRSNPDKYIKTLGTGTSSTLVTAPRLQKVFLGNLDNSIDIDSVKDFLNSIKYNYTDKEGNPQSKSISFSNLSEIVKQHNRWRGFNFEILYSDRGMVLDKSIWPAGCIIDFTYGPRRPTASSLLSTVTQSVLPNSSSSIFN
jgi:hypothetical protein